MRWEMFVPNILKDCSIIDSSDGISIQKIGIIGQPTVWIQNLYCIYVKILSLPERESKWCIQLAGENGAIFQIKILHVSTSAI